MTDNQTPGHRRRRVVQTLGATAVAALAGCLGGDDETEAEAEAAVEDWQAATLEDSTTGEEFEIEEFDQPTFVHTFASNCATCARQQEEFVAFYDERDEIEIVELSVDPNDTPEDLADHAEDADLAWHVGVSPEAVTGALVEEFGQEVSISAQSPIILVCPDGEIDSRSKVVPHDELDAWLDETC